MKDCKVPTGSHWKKILNEIYNTAPNTICEGEKFRRNDDNHPLAKKIKISGEELFLGVSFLEEQGLIEVKRGSGKEFYNTWKLTEKGFNIALENQKAKSIERTQKIVAIGTANLVLFSLKSLFVMDSNSNLSQKVFAYTYGILFFLSLFALIISIIPLIKKLMDETFPQ